MLLLNVLAYVYRVKLNDRHLKTFAKSASSCYCLSDKKDTDQTWSSKEFDNYVSLSC